MHSNACRISFLILLAVLDLLSLRFFLQSGYTGQRDGGALEKYAGLP